MKEKYTTPEMELKCDDCEDIITASHGDNEDETPFVPYSR